MNAYELADELENALDEDSWCQECALEHTAQAGKNAATMLRQQADQIAELEKASNKPVAWMNQEKNAVVTKPYDLWGNPSNEFNIPLYTHPVKQLSDEGIWEVINRTAWVGTEEEIRFKIANAIIKEITE